MINMMPTKDEFVCWHEECVLSVFSGMDFVFSGMDFVL